MPFISLTVARLQHHRGDSDAPPSICLAGHAVLQMVKVGDAGCDSLQTDGREERGSQPGSSEDPAVTALGTSRAEWHKATEEATVCRLTMLERCF